MNLTKEREKKFVLTKTGRKNLKRLRQVKEVELKITRIYEKALAKGESPQVEINCPVCGKILNCELKVRSDGEIDGVLFDGSIRVACSDPNCVFRFWDSNKEAHQILKTEKKKEGSEKQVA